MSASARDDAVLWKFDVVGATYVPVADKPAPACVAVISTKLAAVAFALASSAERAVLASAVTASAFATSAARAVIASASMLLCSVVSFAKRVPASAVSAP
jgi:hypothetical protein